MRFVKKVQKVGDRWLEQSWRESFLVTLNYDQTRNSIIKKDIEMLRDFLLTDDLS